MVLLDSAIIATSLPRMAQTFGVEPIELSIGISIYLVSVAAFVPLSGWLSDRFGARRIFLLSIIVFVAASLACGTADTLGGFVLARAVQGLGGALMTPIGRVIVLNHAPKNELVRAMAYITWPALTAPVIGPVVGGFITTYFSWRWNFWINLPIGLLAWILVWRVIPPTAPVGRRAFDPLGFVLSAGALVALLVGLESIAHGWMAITHSLVLAVIGLVLGWQRYITCGEHRSRCWTCAHSKCRRLQSPVFTLALMCVSASMPRLFYCRCCFNWVLAIRRSKPARMSWCISSAIWG